MSRSALGLFLLICVSPLAGSAHLVAEAPPRVRIILPPNVSSKNAQIVYFMTGAFGGYGGYADVGKEQSTYEIVAAVKDVPAATIKLVAYLPGCQIESIDRRIQSPEETLQLSCVPLAQIPLRGQIASNSKVLPGSRIEVNYLAEWASEFFGIMDGPVTSIRIADADVDQNGLFTVSVPDFHTQFNLGEGGFQFVLREASGNRTILRPVDDSARFHCLKVQAFYPSLIRLIPE